jgi:hypothetical protein
MEAIDYVKLFKLDQENFDFKREEFISELGKEFLEYCQTTTIGRDNKSGIIYYYRFREIVKNFEFKFWAISELKVGEPLSQKLWDAFFATQVVPLRRRLYPKMQKRIEEQRQLNSHSKQDKKSSDPKKANYGKRNNRSSWQ